MFEIIDGAPRKIRVVVSGDAGKSQAKRGGMYYLAPDEINGKRYWYSKSGYHAIWWCNEGFWLLGTYEALQSSTGAIKGPDNQDA